jgi:hypothetical protein
MNLPVMPLTQWGRQEVVVIATRRVMFLDAKRTGGNGNAFVLSLLLSYPTPRSPNWVLIPQRSPPLKLL